MSELVNARKAGTSFRRQLLATASALTLIGAVYGAGEAKAADDDGDHPSVWIELGGQLSRMDDGQEAFTPVFPNSPARPSIFSPSQKFERLPLYSVDETGAISFQPDDSSWILSASVRYGRSSSDKHVRQQTHPKTFIEYPPNYPGQVDTVDPDAQKFADTNAQIGETHAILDFQAGKDVGMGMFGGKDALSVFDLGVRFAQFSSKSNITLKSNPDWRFHYKYINLPSLGYTNFKIVDGQPFHSNAATLTASRSFRGIGPSLSWNASASFAGNTKEGELTFDWGLNAAVLFGRQKAKTHHQTTGRYHPAAKYATRPITFQGPATPDHTRARTVTVPNVGGFAGLTFRVENFKMSAGYRADLFFGAMDGGIDAAKKENVDFYGPFATISVGIGG
jgi:hypothetical protein